MKTCPKCGAQFGDEMSFCLEDGARLVDPTATAEYGEKTVELPSAAPPPTQEFESRELPAQQPATTFQPPPHSSSGEPPFSPPGVRRKGSGSRYLLPLVLTGLALVTFGVGTIGLVAYFYTKRSDIAAANVNEVNRPVGNPQNIATNSNSASQTVPFPVSNSSQVNAEPVSNSEPKQSPQASPRNPTPTQTPNRTAVDQRPATPPEVTPTPERRAPKTISGGVLNGKAISLPRPPYPPAARAVRASGPVAVQVLIDENGQVISASAVSGHPLLRAAAEQAARGARFSPTLLAGQPVKVSGVITYNFVP